MKHINRKLGKLFSSLPEEMQSELIYRKLEPESTSGYGPKTEYSAKLEWYHAILQSFPISGTDSESCSRNYETLARYLSEKLKI